MASLRRYNLSRAILNKSLESCISLSSIFLEESIPGYPTKYLDKKEGCLGEGTDLEEPIHFIISRG